MKRPLAPEELRLWSRVVEDVQPRPGVEPPPAPPEPEPAATGVRPSVQPPPRPAPRTRARGGPHTIEPNRVRRISLGREATGAPLDLHGMSQAEAQNRLTEFVLCAQAEGRRAVLVITGKGPGGDGVLRRNAPEWLASPLLRGVVAGVSEARPRHGGKGALYVALKRRAER
ncbi:MAG TPA: Smr/MutS family protein [Caulobacteraceae bacterium]|jgi:DNA-nicking Smr family endonuclease